MSRKTWLLSSCGALLVGGLATMASAKGVSLDVRVVGADPGAIILDNKHVQLTAPGQKVQMEAWLTVHGGNGPTPTAALTDDQFTLLGGSLVSYKGAVAQPVGAGRFNPLGVEVFDPETGDPLGNAWWVDPIGGGNGSTLGKRQNLSFDTALFGPMPDDGSEDVGGTLVDSLTLGDWIYVRAGGTGVIKGGSFLNAIVAAGNGQKLNPSGISIKVMTFEWELTNMNMAGLVNETMINLMPRVDLLTSGGTQMSKNTGVWLLDNVGANYDPQSQDSLKLGAPVVLNTIIPEPASLSILALGALGLLARRRK